MLIWHAALLAGVNLLSSFLVGILGGFVGLALTLGHTMRSGTPLLAMLLGLGMPMRRPPAGRTFWSAAWHPWPARYATCAPGG